jgi:predicted MPP superfamily phosphohydrolase
VWGNNDVPDAIAPLARQSGVRVLDNAWTTVSVDGASLTLAGLDDPVTGRADWELLMREPPPAPVVLLAHSPDAFPEAVRRGLPAVLCGHTHGGQVWHPFVALAPELVLGLKPGTPAYRAGRYRSGASSLFVSRGLGMSKFRFRFLCPPEIVLIRLRAAEGGPG